MHSNGKCDGGPVSEVVNSSASILQCAATSQPSTVIDRCQRVTFLDPVGSLVSTLLVSGLWVVGHTFSKLVNFDCCSVVML